MKLKKIAVFCLALVMFAGVFAFVGCQPNENSEATTVMNVSLNPEVEFVLDGNGKVITVNALNEEGNLVVSAEAFSSVEGKTAEEAAKLFVQISKETGYLVSGKVQSGENELKFSFSGSKEDADKLYADVKTAVEGYLSKENVSATLNQVAAITNEQLQKLVEECSPYLDKAKVEAMEYKELLKQLAESRKETAELYSQELKNAYYEAKAFAMEQAKMEVLRGQLNSLQQLAFDGLNQAYTVASDTIEKLRLDNLVSENSAYQKALADLRSKKTDYLNFRNEVSQMEQSQITEIVTAQLDALEAALNVAEQTLLSLGETANASIDNAKKTLDTAYDAMMQIFSSVNVDSLVDDISAKQTQAMDKMFSEFETTYASAKQAAENDWKAMEENLKKGYKN